MLVAQFFLNKNLCVVPANQQKTDQTVISFLFLLGGVVVCVGGGGIMLHATSTCFLAWWLLQGLPAY